MEFIYTNDQYCEMVRMLALCGDNVETACERFYEKFQIRVSPLTMENATISLRQHGTVRQEEEFATLFQQDYPDMDLQDDICDYFQLNPRGSARRAAKRIGCNQVQIWRVLMDDFQHPIHFRRNNDDIITPVEGQPRVMFCQWLIRNLDKNILWTGEKNFTKNETREVPYPSMDNPPEDFITQNVWGAIIGRYIIGPVFFERNMTEHTYEDFIRYTLQKKISEWMEDEDIPLGCTKDIYFQNPGAGPYFLKGSRHILEKEYGMRWIGRMAPNPWPQRSHDLTPVDFFLWPRVKAYVYANGYEPANEAELREKIKEAFDELRKDEEVLPNLKDIIRRRAFLCIHRVGRRFEHLLPAEDRLVY